MYRAKLLLLTALMQACGLYSARAPLNFSKQARPVPVEFPWAGLSGTKLGELSLKGEGTVVTSEVIRTTVTAISTHQASDSLQIMRGDQVLWQVHCTSIFDSKQLPSAQLACLFQSAQREVPPLSLALSSMGAGRLKGAFFSERGVWRIEAINRLGIGLYLDWAVGWALRKEGADAPSVFVEQYVYTRPEILVAPNISEEDIRALAPLLLTWVKIPDARTGRGSSGPPLISVPDVRQLPLPPPLPSKPTAHERHAQQLIDMGEPDAARALCARILETQ